MVKFAKYLPRYGWEPVVVASRPKAHYWALDRSLLNEIPPGATVYRTGCLDAFYVKAVLEKKQRKKS